MGRHILWPKEVYNLLSVFILGLSLLIEKVEKKKSMGLSGALYGILILLVLFNMVYFVDYNLNLIIRGTEVSYYDIFKGFYGFIFGKF